jgi:hypothetical protein
MAVALTVAVGWLVPCPARAGPEDELLEALANDSSPRVRAQAALALRPLAADYHLQLRAALKDDSPVVRAAAARALTDAAPTDAFPDLVAAAADDDPLVSRPARLAACRLLGRAARVQVDVRRMLARVAAPEDWATKVLHSEVLSVLLIAGRFEVTRNLDFSDEAEEEPEMVVTDWRQGPVFRQPPPRAPDGPLLQVALRGDAQVVERTSEGVRVKVSLRISAMSGIELCLGEATAWGRPGSAAADEEDGPDKGDLVALRTAARMATRVLAGTLSGVPTAGL